MPRSQNRREQVLNILRSRMACKVSHRDVANKIVPDNYVNRSATSPVCLSWVVRCQLPKYCSLLAVPALTANRRFRDRASFTANPDRSIFNRRQVNRFSFCGTG